MADKNKIVNIKAQVDSNQAEDDLKRLSKEVDNLNGEDVNIDTDTNADKTSEKIGKLSDETKKATNESKELSKQSKKTGKSFAGLKGLAKGAGTAIKGIGTAMKTAGIGLVVVALGALANIMSKNQKVMDTMSAVMNSLQLGFNAITDAISSAWERASELTGGFDALKKVMGGVLTLALTPMKLAFYELKGAMQAVNLAYQKLFGDDESVKQAQEDLAETSSKLLQIGKDAVQAGKDIANNFSEAVSETVTGVTALGQEMGKIEPKKIWESAKAMTELKNSAEVASVIQQGLVEEYDRQAEKLRQLRDDDRSTIEDRIKANNELKEVLEEQREAMLKQADAQIASAQAQYDANQSQENYIALLETLNNKKAVQAQIEGFISEQKMNEVALDKELIDLKNATIEATENETIAKKKAIADNISDETLRLQTLRDIYEEEKVLELERLTNKRDSYQEGTQLWIDAQNELVEAKKTYHEEDKQWEQDIRDQKAEQLAFDLENEYLSFEEKRTKLQEQRDSLLSDESLTDQQRTALLRENSEQRRAIDEAEMMHKAQVQGQVADLVGQFGGFLQQIAGENKELAIAGVVAEQVASVSKIISATGVANAKAVSASPLTGGQPFVAFNTISAGLSIAGGLAGAKKAISDINSNKKSPSASGLGSTGGGGGALSASTTKLSEFQQSNFDAVGNQVSNVNTQAQANANAQSDAPVRAYVTSGDVSSAQSLERNRVDVSGF